MWIQMLSKVPKSDDIFFGLKLSVFAVKKKKKNSHPKHNFI